MDILSALQGLLSFEVIFAVLLGTVGGIVIGALPGLSATMGIALLIPLTYGMGPIAAIAMLATVYTSAVYGGSISAILIHTPGTPASAATALDGYQLQQQGKGFKALGVSTAASVIGGVISGFALLFISPQLAKVSLMFSSGEYFLIAVFGLTIIGSLAGDNMIKGIIAGCIGLMVGLIGMNTTAFSRWSFGNVHLMAGINTVPAMIGLFSIPQVLELVEQRRKASANEESAEQEERIKAVQAARDSIKGRFLPTGKEFKRIFPTIIRSTIIGIFVGILPGAGGDIGSWVSYNEAKRASKHPEEFGKGSIEGVAASEAGNNAVCGGALIPMLTLGIPGSAAVAVLQGGLIIQGLNPGWELFSKYADMTYSVIIAFIAANILMGLFGMLLSKYAVKLSLLPPGILMPSIVILSVIGSFCINRTMFDVYVMLVFGLVGYLMRKFRIPAAPVVLAIILGPMAERNLIQSISMSYGKIVGYYFSRPLCVVFLVLILLALLSPTIGKFLSKKIQKKYE